MIPPNHESSVYGEVEATRREENETGG